MKKRKFIIDVNERAKFLEVFTLLDYKIESETPRGNNLEITLIKEKEDLETSVVENDLVPRIIPMWWLLIPAVLVICIMTAYMIVQFGKFWDVDKYVKFFTFFIPAAVLIGVDAIIFMVRSNAISKIIKNQPTLIQDIKNRLKK